MKINSKFLKSSLVIALVAVMLVAALAVIPTKALAASDNGWTARAHVQSIGWDEAVTGIPVVAQLPTVNNTTDALTDAVIGTTGRFKRLEALDINVPEGVTLQYRAHVQKDGWQNWTTANSTLVTTGKTDIDSSVAGTVGQFKRLEAIQIAVSGLTNYDLYYRAHAQSFGWGPWVKALDATVTTVPTKETANKDYAGTMGLYKRLEAIEMVLVLNEDGKAALEAKRAEYTTKLNELYNDGNGTKAGFLPEADYNKAVTAMNSALTEAELQAAYDAAEDALMPNVHTVYFVDTQFSNNKSVKTDEEGKVPEENVPKLVDKDGKYRLLGWSKEQNSSELVDLKEEVIEENINLYSVWVLNAKAVVNLHYDGKTNEDGSEKVVPISNKYLAGDIIESKDFSLDAEYKSSNPGVKYTQKGWYVEEGETKTAKVLETTYQIPVAKEPTDGEEIASVVVDLYPAWDIEISSVSGVNSAKLTELIEELTTLQGEEGNCGNLEFDANVTLDNALELPEGVTLTFDAEVEVGDDVSLNEEIVTKGSEAEITKLVSNTNVAGEAIGLNDSLNNKLYDLVKLEDDITKAATNVKIEEETSAKLDLNNHDLKFNYSSTFENDGKLEITNSGDAEKGVFTKGGIVNKGQLTIGENKEDEEVAVKVSIKNYSNSTEATVKNSEGATLTINDTAEIQNVTTSASKAAVLNEKGGTLLVEGGKIDCTTDAKTPAILNEGTATIKEGDFDRTANSSTKGLGFYVIVNHGDMTIEGGTFKANTNTATSAIIENGYYTSAEALEEDGETIKKEASLTITGGNFTGGRYTIKNDYAGTATITGGKYTAKPMTTTDNGTETKGIFKTIGEMELDFSKATAEDTEINLGTTGTQTALVLIGDQKRTVDESKTDKVLKNKITVRPFDNELVKINGEAITEDKIEQLIEVEKGKGEKNNLVKSEITVHVGAEDPTVAGQELLALIKKFVAKEMQGVNKDKNTVNIILDTDVEIPAQVDSEPEYALTAENTTLYLNGKQLKIHALYTFSNNITVKDGPDKTGGRITLTSELTDNVEKELFVDNQLLPDEQLKEIADEEVGVE